MPFMGDRLRDARQRKNLSLLQLAEICCTSKSRISMYERGERNPKHEMLEKLGIQSKAVPTVGSLVE